VSYDVLPCRWRNVRWFGYSLLDLSPIFGGFNRGTLAYVFLCRFLVSFLSLSLLFCYLFFVAFWSASFCPSFLDDQTNSSYILLLRSVSNSFADPFNINNRSLVVLPGMVNYKARSSMDSESWREIHFTRSSVSRNNYFYRAYFINVWLISIFLFFGSRRE
jgi:hypothetical protein